MSRLIDADALIHELNNSHFPGAPYVDAGISIAIGKVLDAPTIEPERKNGKWIDKSGGIECAWNYCSVCGEQAIDLYDFCPNCGADMRGEQIKELLETDVVTVFEVLKAAHDKIEEWLKRSEQDE